MKLSMPSKMASLGFCAAELETGMTSTSLTFAAAAEEADGFDAG